MTSTDRWGLAAPRRASALLGCVVALCFLVAGTTWALSSAPGSSPDDTFHLASIWCAHGPEGPDSATCRDANGAPTVPADVVQAPCFAFDASVSGACSYKLPRTFIGADVNNGTYPGLFYDAMHVFVGDSVAKSVVRMRLANVCLAALMLGAAVALLPLLLRRAVALAWLGTLVPLFLFLVPSTNPSSWVLIGVGTYWAWLLMFLTDSSRPRTYAAGGFALLSALLAAGSRADGAAFIALSTVAVGLIALRDRRALVSLRLLLPAVVLVAMAYSYLTSNQTASLGGFGATAGPGRSGSELLLHNVFNLPSLLLGVFGLNWGLGWLDTILLPAVGALSFAAAAVLFVVSSAAMWLRKALAIALLGVALVAIPLYTLQGGGNFVGENVQPRYVLPLVTVTLGLCLLSENAPGRSWCTSTRTLVFVAVALSLANAQALHTNIRRYVSGVDVATLNLNKGREWWWGSPVTPLDLWIAGCVAGAALFAALVWAGSARVATAEPELVAATPTTTD